MHRPTSYHRNVHDLSQHSGSVIVSILIITFFLTTLVYSLIVLANSNLSRARGRILVLQSQYAAESGGDAAIALLNSTNGVYTGTSGNEVTVLTNAQYKATYKVTVVNGASSNDRVITAQGRVYVPATAGTPRYIRNIEVYAKRSSTSSATSMVSRNIVNVDSGVKSIRAVDVMLNGYIKLNKNTTDFIAENITVGGRNTSASNCSIDGTGNLVKPTSFTHAGQTKTNLIMAFNNCINPPGNTSNANFTVLANQNTISQIQSTYIPWSQFMDASYQNSPSGCADWTTGSFPRSIPSTGNDKKTHYPDSVSTVSSACGNSGDLFLPSGQYTIRNHVHIRANLCTASACNPTFYNPDTGAAGLKFIFVEGTVNFSAVQTAPGSGPIVLVTYGSDPASLAGACPTGGSIYLGNNVAQTNAPALYLSATNGVCLDKTKFGAANALGGLSGKNLHIASSPGTPFDLGMDPTFPASSIPINLSWKATQYRRL